VYRQTDVFAMQVWQSVEIILLFVCLSFVYIVAFDCLFYFQINLLSFSANELIVWSNLEHPDIVELYGAMLYKEHVLIFQELIRGLCHFV